jgi:hypothetical protein
VAPGAAAYLSAGREPSKTRIGVALGPGEHRHAGPAVEEAVSGYAGPGIIAGHLARISDRFRAEKLEPPIFGITNGEAVTQLGATETLPIIGLATS